MYELNLTRQKDEPTDEVLISFGVSEPDGDGDFAVIYYPVGTEIKVGEDIVESDTSKSAFLWGKTYMHLPKIFFVK